MSTEVPSRAGILALFEREERDGEATRFSLPGGAPLFLAGEAADTLYLLRTGRLAASRHEGAQKRFLGIIRPGEPAGEFSLIAGAPHSADVIALRDSELLALPKHAFLRAAATDAPVMAELAKVVVTRARQPAGIETASEPKAFALIGIADGPVVRRMAEAIAVALQAIGYAAVVVDSAAQSESPEWLSTIEGGHDFVLFVAEAHEVEWIHLLSRQMDRLFLVAHAAEPLPANDKLAVATSGIAGAPDLILLHDISCQAPGGSAKWANVLHPRQFFHLRADHAPDIERMARVLAGRAVGLVLSGGAARAFAHIGALRALQAAGVPIDFVAGVSMGAIVAAGEAMGWSNEELDARIRKAFVESSPVDDIAVPLIALTRGRKVRARLAEHFGETHIADLWRPFFCVSSNLTTGVYQIHNSGLVREALTASASLPGLLPPMILGQDVLVDGAVMKNFPVDVMRRWHSGPIIGVDVSRGRSIEAKDVTGQAVNWKWLVSGAWRRGPPIVSLLMRAATVGADHDLAAARDAADLLILPEVDEIEIRDWKAYESAVAQGEIATNAALANLATPINRIRRRPSVVR